MHLIVIIIAFFPVLWLRASAAAEPTCPCAAPELQGYMTTWLLDGAIIPAGTDPANPGILDIDAAVGKDRQEVELAASITSLEGPKGKTRDLLLCLGSTGGAQVAINGQVVFEGEGVRPWTPSQHQRKVRLNAELNRVVVKLKRPTDGPWRFSLRFRSLDGGDTGDVRPYIVHLQYRDKAVEPVAEERFRKLAPVSIFDGATLAGWEGNLDRFRVEDGAIVAGSRNREVPYCNQYLCTKKEYKDFELRLKARLLCDNSGVCFRGHRAAGKSEFHAYQMDMGANNWGALYDERATRVIGIDADLAKLVGTFDPDGWNEFRIRCVGPRIQCWLNGRITIDYTESNRAIPLQGKIGLQLYGWATRRPEARFKDITIKELHDERAGRIQP